MCRAHQGRPAPPTDRNRRAFPHGKACSGCAASLPPPLCTAVRRLARRDPPTAALAADGLQSTSPSRWSRPDPRSGRPSAALKRGSACGDRTAPVLSPSTTLVRASDRRHWALTGERCTGGARPPNCQPCLPEPAQATGWSDPCRFAADENVRRLYSMICTDRCYTPVRPVRDGRGRAVRAAGGPLCRRGRAGPRPDRVPGYPSRSSRPALGSWTWFGGAYRLITERCAQLCSKVNVRAPARHRPSPNLN